MPLASTISITIWIPPSSIPLESTGSSTAMNHKQHKVLMLSDPTSHQQAIVDGPEVSSSKRKTRSM